MSRKTSETDTNHKSKRHRYTTANARCESRRKFKGWKWNEKEENMHSAARINRQSVLQQTIQSSDWMCVCVFSSFFLLRWICKRWSKCISSIGNGWRHANCWIVSNHLLSAWAATLVCNCMVLNLNDKMLFMPNLITRKIGTCRIENGIVQVLYHHLWCVCTINCSTYAKNTVFMFDAVQWINNCYRSTFFLKFRVEIWEAIFGTFVLCEHHSRTFWLLKMKVRTIWCSNFIKFENPLNFLVPLQRWIFNSHRNYSIAYAKRNFRNSHSDGNGKLLWQFCQSMRANRRAIDE